MGKQVLIADWTTIQGDSADSVLLPCPADAIVSVADAEHAVVNMEVAYATTHGAAHPILRLLGAPTLDGPWVEVESRNAAGTDTFLMSRDPGGTAQESLKGFLMWEVQEPGDATGTPYVITFRISAVLS
ncbi:MAG: hypothetical protein FJ087_13625 [Deltaproteobacteria bacterium]|nr:hypothetical protein [Deltaproteobacteria bacterium]